MAKLHPAEFPSPYSPTWRKYKHLSQFVGGCALSNFLLYNVKENRRGARLKNNPKHCKTKTVWLPTYLVSTPCGTFGGHGGLPSHANMKCEMWQTAQIECLGKLTTWAPAVDRSRATILTRLNSLGPGMWKRGPRHDWIPVTSKILQRPNARRFESVLPSSSPPSVNLRAYSFISRAFHLVKSWWNWAPVPRKKKERQTKKGGAGK